MLICKKKKKEKKSRDLTDNGSVQAEGLSILHWIKHKHLLLSYKVTIAQGKA